MCFLPVQEVSRDCSRREARQATKINQDTSQEEANIMKVKELIEGLKLEDPELNIELTKVLALTKPKDASGNVDAYEMRLDFPIIGTATKDGDLYLIIQAAPEMIAFGKDVKRLDGKPMTDEDLKAIGVKKDG